MSNTSNKPTRQELEDYGYTLDGNVWVSPITGECLSFEQARAEYAEAEERLNADY